jgi:hypothetical protein
MAGRVCALEQAIRATDLAMVGCDRALRVAWSNPLADALLAGNPHLTVRGGTLVASAAKPARRCALVAEAAGGQADVLALGTPVTIRCTCAPWPVPTRPASVPPRATKCCC